jgi:hypothetical protein
VTFHPIPIPIPAARDYNPIRFGSNEVMESMRHDPGDQQPPPVSSPGVGRGPRRVLVTVAVVVGAFAVGWLYSTFIGCHAT